MGQVVRFVVIALIRLALLALSVAGWIMFVVGFVRLNRIAHKHYIEVEKEFGDLVNIKQLLHLFNTIIIPMWLFLASGVVTYITLGLHIIVRHETLKHILHSILMFLNVLYMFGASGTSIIALVYSMDNKSVETLRNIAYIDQQSAKMVLYGVTLAMGKYWISTLIWPLFEIRCKRSESYYPVLPVSIQDNSSIGIQRRPLLKNFSSNSGRFSNSRELLQQVSEEEHNYDWSTD